MQNTHIYIEGNLVSNAKLTTRKISNGRELELVHVTIALNTKEHIPGTEMRNTNFYEVTYGGHGYKYLAETLKKGDSVSASGYFYVNKYEKDGVERTALRIEADKLNMLVKPIKKEKEEEKTNVFDTIE